MTSGPDDKLEYAGPEWSEQVKSAIREAVAAAVIEHQRKGNHVSFADDAGCLCVLMPDGQEHRLTDVEIKALTQ